MDPTLFDVLTSHSRAEEISTKLVQPPWFRLSKFLIYILLSISFVAGALKFQYDTLNCNVIECVYNETITSMQTCPQFKTQSLDADPTYNFISDKCRDQNIHWVLETIPILYFIIAIALWSCSSIWLSIPRCTIYIERFVGLVKDCNTAIERYGWFYKDCAEKWNLVQMRPSGSFFCRPWKRCKKRVSSGMDTMLATYKGKEEKMWHKYSEDGNKLKDAELEQLNNLHDRLSHMMNDKNNYHVSVVLVVQQSILTVMSLVFFLCISCGFFRLDFLRSEYTCILDEYSMIACYYRLYTMYSLLAILFCICIFFHCVISCLHLCWVIYHLTTHDQSTFFQLSLPRDLYLLLNLLTSNDHLVCEGVELLMGTYFKNEVTNQILSFENLQKLAQGTDGEQLTLYNLTCRPRSFDRLHQLKNLQVLQLINCNLTEIPTCVLKCETLERADFTCNKIQTIIPNSQTSNITTRLCTLILDKNPVLASTLKHFETWPLRLVSLVDYPEEDKGDFAKTLFEVMRNKQNDVCIDKQLFGEIKKQKNNQDCLVELNDVGDIIREREKYIVVYRVQNRYEVKQSIIKLRESILTMDNPTLDDPIMHQLFMLEKALDQSNGCQKVVGEFKVFKGLHQPQSDRLGKKCQEIVDTLSTQIKENFEQNKCYKVDKNMVTMSFTTYLQTSPRKERARFFGKGNLAYPGKSDHFLQ